jgi:rhodanese-related sulfurtransferase
VRADTSGPTAFARENQHENRMSDLRADVEALTGFVAEPENSVILDVRTPMEYEISQVPGAINTNVQDDSFTDLASNLDSAKTYIVYCTKNPAGGRSMTALAKMKELGFKNLKSLDGGHVAWTDAEFPMTRKEEP